MNLILSNEHSEQAALFEYADIMSKTRPEWGFLFAIPNGGKRHIVTAKRMKKEGQKSGIPDIFLPVSRRGFHGMFIELKAGKNKPTKDQERWIDALKEQGYSVAICRGWEAAKKTIEEYLEE